MYEEFVTSFAGDSDDEARPAGLVLCTAMPPGGAPCAAALLGAARSGCSCRCSPRTPAAATGARASTRPPPRARPWPAEAPVHAAQLRGGWPAPTPCPADCDAAAGAGIVRAAGGAGRGRGGYKPSFMPDRSQAGPPSRTGSGSAAPGAGGTPRAAMTQPDRQLPRGFSDSDDEEPPKPEQKPKQQEVHDMHPRACHAPASTRGVRRPHGSELWDAARVGGGRARTPATRWCSVAAAPPAPGSGSWSSAPPTSAATTAR